ncbi:MAG TPA: 1-(5-phosphoribosyl)-5-[(5-phosphoribosylamino)methylideneamino]imidazole-4-carboxamide isomerase [Methanoculleus sp.]|nr:1-(5-phosphoribosyl)-5-[(5-phosphoribosylamino)methylideneamino]imidazole-4-carboxamide isomerase [Methanoculleus sp.]
MKIYPAVDILGGRCVQLVQGDRTTATDYGDPVIRAIRWLDEGADALHIVNLDGAFGDAESNAAVIKDILSETGAEVQLGGGIRSVGDATGWLEIGVDRVILGTLATKEPGCIRELGEEFGSSRIMAGVDARDGQVVVRGWEELAGDYIEWARRFEALGAGSLLFTNVNVEGLQRGIDPEPVRRLVAATDIAVVASGGVTTPADVHLLADIGAAGIVLGSALYSGKITLREALEAGKKK